MISAEDARTMARRTVAALCLEHDDLLATKVTVGAPVSVHDVAGPPSYWLVPLLAHERAAGFVRVDRDGQTMAVGRFGGSADETAARPGIVTGLSADEAAERARTDGRLAADEVPGTPRFVHDGPPGREVWLVETSRAGRPNRWLFISAAGLYERPAGVRSGEDSSLE